MYKKFIFIANIDGKRTKFLCLDDDCINDGRTAVGRIMTFQNKIVTKGNAGRVYNLETSNEGSTVHFPKKLLPVDYWKNADDRQLWQIEQRKEEDLVNLEKASSIDSLIELLEPFRLKMLSAYSRKERVIILARAIDYLLGNKLY